MKKICVIVAVLALGVLVWKSERPKDPMVGSGQAGFFYNSASMATSSVGIYSWSSVLSADSARGYVSLCNDTLTSASTIYLGLGATGSVSSLAMNGIRLPSGSCYEMTLQKMFYGNVYAIASSATTTLLKVVGSY